MIYKKFNNEEVLTILVIRYNTQSGKEVYEGEIICIKRDTTLYKTKEKYLTIFFKKKIRT